MVATKMIDDPSASESGFRLKGGHVLAMTLAFFAIVIGVNIVMAYLAVETFSGVQTDKPYENGLAFNREIKAAEAQSARQWTVAEHIERNADGIVTVRATFQDAKTFAIGGLDVKTSLKAPADSKRDQIVDLTDHGDGVYDGKVNAPAGQWDVETVARRNNEVVYRSVNRVILK